MTDEYDPDVFSAGMVDGYSEGATIKLDALAPLKGYTALITTRQATNIEEGTKVSIDGQFVGVVRSIHEQDNGLFSIIADLERAKEEEV